MADKIEFLKELGSEWEKNGMHRIYFNDLPGWYGLQYERYNSGNVSSATLDGEHISNSKATGILSDLLALKIWYDVTTERFYWKAGLRTDPQYFARIVAAIRARAAEMVREKAEGIRQLHEQNGRE